MAFRNFVREWEMEDQRKPGVVRWDSRSLRGIGDARVPTHLLLRGTWDLAQFLGVHAVERLGELKKRFMPFVELGEELKAAAEERCHDLEKLPVEACQQIASAVRQFRRGIGDGLYLRALPLQGIDTKFVERRRALVEYFANAREHGAIEEAGGLLAWLGCLSKGQDKVIFRVLCPDLRQQLWGLDPVWVATETLSASEPRAKRLLVVENDISGLALPDCPDTVAVVGCGGNLAWMGAPWVQNMSVGYWGDLDTWGLKLLASARNYAPHLNPIMMDDRTWEAHPEAVVLEPESAHMPTNGLADEELKLFATIRGTGACGHRIEQEKLMPDWIAGEIGCWVDQTER